MKIPVFVSCPTTLSASQERSRSSIVSFLDKLNLEPRALGRSDYPSDLPLREVLVIARHCAGGLILGFEQFRSTAGTWKRDTKEERRLVKTCASFPSPWNQLEAGILFGLGLPLLIFRESSITGGIFDNGVTDVFIHKMTDEKLDVENKESLKEVFLKWHGKVSAQYFSE